MFLTNFHFAQPVWLLGIFIVPVVGLWLKYYRKFSKNNFSVLTKFIDEKLLPHLLVSSEKIKRKHTLDATFALLISLLFVSLANPRWDYKDIEAYAPTASMVILLDLSSSMNNKDVVPSRVIRARQNIEDLLNLSSGLKVGLLGFAANPHLISPITDDIQTIKGFLPALDTDLISKQGRDLGLAFNYAADLLKSEPGDKKSVLLLSDGDFSNTDYIKSLKTLKSDNIQIYVMGIGKADKTQLQTIAKAGNGLYVEANSSENGIKIILSKAQHTTNNNQVATGKIRQWEDRYYMLLLPAVICLLYLMSQRVFYSIFLVVTLGLFCSPESQAFEISSLFKNSDQRAAEEFSQTNFSQASELFHNTYNKGVALYRSGNFCAAEQQFALIKDEKLKTDSTYNAGNAQMQQKKWRAAINSYEQVLKTESEHADAKFNLELARKMLAEYGDQDQTKDQNQNQQGKDQQQQDNSQSDQPQQQQAPQWQPMPPPSITSPEDDPPQDAPDTSPPQIDEPPQDDYSPADDAKLSRPVSPEQEARAEQWLNRIDSDIKVFLKQKFYIEDQLGLKK